MKLIKSSLFRFTELFSTWFSARSVTRVSTRRVLTINIISLSIKMKNIIAIFVGDNSHENQILKLISKVFTIRIYTSVSSVAENTLAG